MFSLKIFLFFTFGITNFFYLSASTPQSVNLNDFPPDFSIDRPSYFLDLHNQRIQVRGFWYPLSSERGILSLHSGLKSCCLSKTAHLYQQLLVKGEREEFASFPSQRVMTLEGIFKIDPIYNLEGQVIQFYVLEQAKEVPKHNSYKLLLSLIFLILLFFIWKFFSKRQTST